MVGWTSVSAADCHHSYCKPAGVATDPGPGNHTIAVGVGGKRNLGNRYYFAIDTIDINLRGFKPNGL